MEDCLFCKITKGELPSEKVFESEKIIAFKNIKPVAEVHILVIPKKHVANFMEIDPETIVELKTVVQSLIKKLKLEKGYKLVINGGIYQFVPHFHWHLLSGKFRDSAVYNT